MIDKNEVLEVLEHIRASINGEKSKNQRYRTPEAKNQMTIILHQLITNVNGNRIFSYHKFMRLVDSKRNPRIILVYGDINWIKNEMRILYKKYKSTLKNKFPKGSKVIFRCAVGSQSYGLQTPSSDVDIKGVYIQKNDDILSNGYVPQIEVNKDEVYYELRRFLELLSVGNPNVLELLYVPNECVFQTSKEFKMVRNRRREFLSKICCDTFYGYGKAQLKKATGLNKKFNWEESKIVRKDLLDFCYVIDGEKTIPWKVWNEFKGFEEAFCGLVSLPNAKDIYAVYYDSVAFYLHADQIPEPERENNKKIRRENGLSMGYGYKGLVKVGESDNLGISNQLRLSSIPKGERSVCNIIYNKDGYSEHCKDFKEYEDWKLKRNETRVATNKSHGQQMDGKNIMHTVRLIMTAQEIPMFNRINVDRTKDRDYLLSIKHGEVDLKDIIVEWGDKANELKELYNKSDLPDKVDPRLTKELELQIRRKIYGNKHFYSRKD